MIRRGPTASADFTMTRNAAAQDETISYRARGLLLVILSRPEHWRGTNETLAADSPNEGREAVGAALRELETAGYLRRVRRKGEGGKWVHEWFVSDLPGSLLDLADVPPPEAPEPDPAALPIDVPGAPETRRSETSPQVRPETGLPPTANPLITKDSNLSVPTERADPPDPAASEKPKPPADLVAKAVYDHTGGMVKYVAIRQIATRALRNGASPEQITAAMRELYDGGRPITLQTVGQGLSTRPRTVPSSAGGAPADQPPRDGERRRFSPDGPLYYWDAQAATWHPVPEGD